MTLLWHRDIKPKLKEMAQVSLRENPIVPEGEGSKKSPALRGIDIVPGKEIAIPPISSENKVESSE